MKKVKSCLVTTFRSSPAWSHMEIALFFFRHLGLVRFNLLEKSILIGGTGIICFLHWGIFKEPNKMKWWCASDLLLKKINGILVLSVSVHLEKFRYWSVLVCGSF